MGLKESISNLEMYRANNSNFDEELANDIDTVLQELENSIPKQVIEQNIKKLKEMTLECETFSSMRDYAVLTLQDILEGK